MRAGVQTADTIEFLTLQAPKAKICLKVNNEKMTSLNFQKFYNMQYINLSNIHINGDCANRILRKNSLSPSINEQMVKKK